MNNPVATTTPKRAARLGTPVRSSVLSERPTSLLLRRLKQMNETLRLEFNEWARAGKGASMERGHRPVGEQAIERMQLPSEAHVLDVGISTLKVPVHLLSMAQYRILFEQAGFVNVIDARLHDLSPIPENYSGGSFKSREDLVR